QPVQLTKYADGQTGAGGFWSPDGQTFFFPRGGGLQAVSVDGGEPRHESIRSAVGASGFAVSPDGSMVAFIAGQGGGPGGGGRGRGGRGANVNPPPPTSASGADL